MVGTQRAEQKRLCHKQDEPFVARVDSVSPQTRGDIKVCGPKRESWAGPGDVKAVT